jgi:hypothetical protein
MRSSVCVIQACGSTTPSRPPGSCRAYRAEHPAKMILRHICPHPHDHPGHDNLDHGGRRTLRLNCQVRSSGRSRSHCSLLDCGATPAKKLRGRQAIAPGDRRNVGVSRKRLCHQPGLGFARPPSPCRCRAAIQTFGQNLEQLETSISRHMRRHRSSHRHQLRCQYQHHIQSERWGGLTAYHPLRRG